MSINTKDSVSSINDRFKRGFDDMFGVMYTGTGNNQWNFAQLRDSGVLIGHLRNNSSDFFWYSAQSPHTREQGVTCKPIHIHYILDAVYTGGQTLIFDISYTWVIPGTIFPALADWTNLTSQSIVLSTENLAQFYTDIVSLTPDIPPPSPEGYGTGLIVKITRGNGTYTGELGIIWADSHIPKDRTGSYNEYND